MFQALISDGNANNGANAGAFYANTNNITMQIEFCEENKVLFTGSQYLLKQLQQIKAEDFPFYAKIELINESYQLT